MTLGLLACASCGARVAPYLGVGAAEGVSPPGSVPVGGQVSNGSTSATGTATAGQSGGVSTAAGGGTAGSGGTGASAPPPQSFSFDPRSEAAACSGSSGNTSSGPGVTPTGVTVGNVSGLTGPLANNFNQGAEAVQALFAAVNAAGGICGRKLVLNVEDDQQDSSTNAADVQDLIGKVEAFVGSLSDADNGGVPAMEQAKVPDFGFAINCSRSESPVYWSPAGGSCAQPDGPNGPYYLNDSGMLLPKEAGYFPSKAAFLSYNIAISAQAAQQFEYLYQHLGGSVCYSDFSISPATASLESDVEAMRNAGCNGVITTLDVTGNAKLLQAMQQQSFTTPYTYTTFDGYTPAMISTAGESAAQGLTVGIPFIPLNESNPTDQLYVSQLATYQPGKLPGGFGFLAWEAAQMFIYCLIAAGRNPTPVALDQIAGSLQNWNGGGALGPYTPNTHSVAPCQVDMVVKGSDFVRRAPSSGLFCGGQMVRASP